MPLEHLMIALSDRQRRYYHTMSVGFMEMVSKMSACPEGLLMHLLGPNLHKQKQQVSGVSSIKRGKDLTPHFRLLSLISSLQTETTRKLAFQSLVSPLSPSHSSASRSQASGLSDTDAIDTRY